MSRSLSFSWLQDPLRRRFGKGSLRAALAPAELAFAAGALTALDEIHRSYEDWRFQVQHSSDYPVLANLAAMRRWELARLAHAFSASAPPPRLERPAADTLRALAMSAQAFQQLTGGYRFSKFERVCEGQALLEEARLLRERVARRWRELCRVR